MAERKAGFSKRGRLKTPKSTQKNTLHSFFVSESTPFDNCSMIRGLIDDVIVNCVEKCEGKKKKHTMVKMAAKTIESWKTQFPWLEVTGEGLDARMLCSVCRQKKVNTIWAESGSTNMQRNALEKHCRTTEHLKAEESCRPMSTSQPSQDDISSPTSEVSSSDEILFRTVFYCAKEELPTSKVNSLLDLQVKNGVNCKYKNISWDTLTEIQACISTTLQREIIAEVLDSEFYALMIDESTDIAVQKHLSVCIRYVKEGEQVTKFLANVAIDDGKAHTIVNELIQCLSSLGLDPSRLVSLATDGASTMTGRKLGVGVQMKAKYSPFVIQTHCIAHRLNLAVTDSIKKDACLEGFRDKFSNLYYFMSASSNRTTTLKKIQALLDEPELTVKEPHSIRWLGLKNAIEAVYWSYGSILVTLSKFAEEKQTAAHGLHKYFSEYKTVLLVSFMLDVHEVLGVLSQQLQKQELIFSEIQPLMEGTLSKLEYLEKNDGKCLRDMKDCIIRTVDETSGEQVATLSGEKLRKYSASVDSELATVRERYLTKLQKNIKSRFKKEDSDLFRDLSLLLEPDTVNASEESDSRESLVSLGTFYGQEKTVKVVYDCATDDNVREEVKEISNLLNEEKLAEEWPMAKGMVQGSYKNLSVKEFCKRMINLHKSALPNFSKLCKIGLCIAVTSVECERSFSVQNRLKSKYRCSLKAENLNVLLNIQMSRVDVASFVPAGAVRLWLGKKKRRKGRLYLDYKPAKKRAKVDTCSTSKC